MKAIKIGMFLATLLALIPALLIMPIDWLYYLFTGSQIVDITYGMIAYFLYVPLLGLIILGFTVYRVISKKFTIKEDWSLLFLFSVLLIYTALPLSGIGWLNGI